MYPIPFLVSNGSQSDNGMVLSRRGRVQFIPWPGGTGLGGFWGVWAALQPLYKVSCTNCVRVCMCVFGDLPWVCMPLGPIQGSVHNEWVKSSVIRKEIGGERFVCQSRKGEGRAYRRRRRKKKPKTCVDELLRSGILVQIMARVYESEAGGAATRIKTATILIHRRSSAENLRCHVQQETHVWRFWGIKSSIWFSARCFWGLDRHHGKKMGTRGADTWQRGKTSPSTSGMFSGPVKSLFWTHLSDSALINQNAISPTQCQLLQTDMLKQNSLLHLCLFRTIFQLYVVTMQSFWCYG